MECKEILINVEGELKWELIAREANEDEYIESGEDEQIYGYVPDEVFDDADDVIARFVEENLV